MHTRTSTLKRTLSAAAVALLVALTAGCANQPATRFDKDPSADLGSYKTFGFFEPTAANNARYATLVTKHLEQATRTQLEHQRYVYSEHDPDLRVNVMVHAVDKLALRSTAPSGFRGRYGWGGWGGGVESVEYRQGTLTIDLVDARRNALVWRGVAEGRLDDKALEAPGAVIDETVAELFAAFPAAAAK